MTRLVPTILAFNSLGRAFFLLFLSVSGLGLLRLLKFNSRSSRQRVLNSAKRILSEQTARIKEAPTDEECLRIHAESMQYIRGLVLELMPYFPEAVQLKILCALEDYQWLPDRERDLPWGRPLDPADRKSPLQSVEIMSKRDAIISALGRIKSTLS